MNYISILLSVALLLLLSFIIKSYLKFYKKNSGKQGFSVAPVSEEKPIVVDDNYLAAQKGLTIKEYTRSIEDYHLARSQRIEKENEAKAKSKISLENKLDDNLGMSF